MKGGLFSLRPFNLLPYCGQRALIADHSRKPVIAVDPGVKFDASFTHPTCLTKTISKNLRVGISSTHLSRPLRSRIERGWTGEGAR
jgi:hypothetical protein